MALYPLEPLKNDTKSLLKDEISVSAYMDRIDEMYDGMLSTEQDQPLLQNKGTYINLNGAMAKLLGQPMMNERIKLKNGHLTSVVSWRHSQEDIEYTAHNITRL